MPEQGGGTQRTGKYCKKVSRWISCTQNGEIPSIFELSLGFSVAKAGAGAKNGDFVEELKIISSTECWNDIVVHVEVRGDASVSDCSVGLTMVPVVVVEMQGEISPLREIWWRSQWGGEWYRVPGR